MSKQLKQAMISILAMPYFKNDSASSGITVHRHENAVALKLKDASFTEELKENYPNLSKKILKAWSKTSDDTKLKEVAKEMPNGTFMLQPSGSQGYPDILVKDFNGKFVALECKSAAGAKPMWNDNLPKQNGMYIFFSSNYDKTTIFMVGDVISTGEVELLERQFRSFKDNDARFEKEMAALTGKLNRNWKISPRPQYSQYGKWGFTNYFKHADREKCEKNALKFALGK